MPRFKLTIEYAGTRYSGWQIQKNARTVQGEIDRATREVTGRRDFELYGSGRTDAGVHALAQVAHLDVSTKLTAEMIRRRLNDELPADIHILSAVVVPHRFHARHDAVARRYLYQIATRRTALAKPYVWWVKQPLHLPPMREGAALLTGMRDFASFTELDDDADERGRGGSTRSTIVLLDQVEIAAAGDLILVAIEGSHFLWKMVRRIVGVLVEIGLGELQPASITDFLGARSDLPAQKTAPASGLFLERVYYKGDRRGAPLAAATPLRTA